MKEHIAHATNDRLAQMVDEIARRHVGDDRDTLNEAARRLRIPPYKTFQDEYMGEAT